MADENRTIFTVRQAFPRCVSGYPQQAWSGAAGKFGMLIFAFDKKEKIGLSADARTRGRYRLSIWPAEGLEADVPVVENAIIQCRSTSWRNFPLLPTGY